MACTNIDLSAGSPSVNGSPPPSLAVSTCAAAQPVYPELSPDGRRLEEYGPKYSPKSPEYDPSYSPSASPSAAKENTPPPRDTSAVGPPRAPSKEKVPPPALKELHPLALTVVPMPEVSHDYSPMPKVPTGLPAPLPLRTALVQAKMDTVVSTSLQKQVAQGNISPLNPVVKRAHGRAISSRSRAKREVAAQEKRVTRYMRKIGEYS